MPTAGGAGGGVRRRCAPRRERFEILEPEPSAERPRPQPKAPAPEAPDRAGGLSIDRYAHFWTVTLRSSVLGEHQARLLDRELTRAAVGSGGRLAIRLEPGSVVASSALASLARAGMSCRSMGGRLVVIDAPRSLRRIIKRTGLARSIGAVADEATAARALRPRGRGAIAPAA